MHPGAATPMHAWGSQTPMHPGATPLHVPATPSWDPTRCVVCCSSLRSGWDLALLLPAASLVSYHDINYSYSATNTASAVRVASRVSAQGWGLLGARSRGGFAIVLIRS